MLKALALSFITPTLPSRPFPVWLGCKSRTFGSLCITTCEAGLSDCTAQRPVSEDNLQVAADLDFFTSRCSTAGRRVACCSRLWHSLCAPCACCSCAGLVLILTTEFLTLRLTPTLTVCPSTRNFQTPPLFCPCIVLALPTPLSWRHAGCGKTAMVEELARLTGNLDMVRVHVDDQMDSKSLLGAYVCTSNPEEFVWQPGPLTQASYCTSHSKTCSVGSADGCTGIAAGQN